MNIFTEIIIITLSTMLVGVISFAVERLIRYMSQKTSNEKLGNALSAAADIINKVVKFTAQTFVSKLKAEGKFTKEKQMDALKLSCQMAKDMMAKEVKATIAETFGNLDKWIRTSVEACVYDDEATREKSVSE